ncbi:Broad specificity phosphatase PhoE [Amycolatopsis marina]|uniref:Broad specificity phosphatase PhoE n=1 Tax=Amycolatopsis marina TaxID=490629 RepID=A0A1I1CCD8_9PSEU|nr:histidine phosphatase family protein [Amycolatopsis marina]SFB58420.1 Broad specificity phosphatase PhoE [Amycolatopsis marina]
MGAVFLVRHGQASFGAADYDVLSEHGAAQSAAVGAELCRRGVTGSGAWCGSMRRQRATAEAALAEIGQGLVAKEDPRWNEYDHLDVLAQHGSPTVQGADPRAFQSVLDAALADWARSGGTSLCAESWPAFSARVRGALDELVAGLGKGEQAVVFTSGGVIAALCAQLICSQPQAGSGLEHTFLAMNRVTANGGITKIVSGRGGLSLLSFNEHGHFDGDGATLLSYR